MTSSILSQAVSWTKKLGKHTSSKAPPNASSLPLNVTFSDDDSLSAIIEDNNDPDSQPFFLETYRTLDWEDDASSTVELDIEDPSKKGEEQPLLLPPFNTPVRSNVGKKSHVNNDYNATSHDKKSPFFSKDWRLKRKKKKKLKQQLHDKEQQHFQDRIQIQRLKQKLQKRVRTRSGKELWASLRAKILNGTFVSQLSRSSYPLSASINQTMVIPPPKKEEEKKQKQPPSSDPTLGECALYLILYLLIGTLAYSVVLESWPIVDSLYFTVVTVTTVGYGDIFPTTWQGRLFTCFFALTGVAILGMVLGELGTRLVEAEIKAVERARETASQRILDVWRNGEVPRKSSYGEEGFDKEGGSLGVVTEDIYDFSDSLRDDELSDSSIFSSTRSVESSSSSITSISRTITRSGRSARQERKRKRELQKLNEQNRQSRLQTRITSAGYYAWSEMFRVFGRYMPAMVPLVCGSIFLAHAENWSYLDAIYYCIVTTTTIGYGDLVPNKSTAKWFAVFFIPLSVGAMGHILGTVANDILERRRKTYESFMLKQEEFRPLTVHDLHIMNDKGEESVSELEYVTYTLVSMGKVDWDTVDELQERFRSWDTTGDGRVNKDDLEAVARRKRRGVQSKLRLQEYKKWLINQSNPIQ